MNTSKELTKEIATFCRQRAKQPKRGVFKSWISKAVLQMVVVALLAVSSDGTGVSPERTNPWVS